MTELEPTAALPESRPSATPMFASVPPWMMVVVAVISVQAGAALAKQLFGAAGPSGVVFLRTSLAAVLFLALWRPKIRGYSRRVYIDIALYGIVIALNMLAFYVTITLIPLGIADAIAFAGPLGVAVFGSRKLSDLAWVGLAAVGIILLSPISNEALNPVGVLLACLTAVLWGLYVVQTKRVGAIAADGKTVLAWGMVIAAVVALPLGIGGAVQVLSDPSLIVLSVVVALLSSAIPFALEFLALQRMSAFAAGLMLSMEPVVATIIGFVLLHEGLDVKEIAGILLVTVAAVGTTQRTSGKMN